MPRPHSLPRRPNGPALPPEGPGRPPSPFPPFDPVPPTRVLAAVNVRRDTKALFDAMQMWLSYREGRAVQQWEAFEALLEEALFAPQGRLKGFAPPR